MSKTLVFNKVPLEEIEIGMNVSYSQTICDADIKAFAGISGDRNPIYLDEDYANNSRFKKRIAHGMMAASYFSALFGTKIPGEGCVYTSQSLQFKRPIYIGDTVIATVEVIGIDKIKRKVRFKTICKVNNKIVTNGEAELFIPMEFNKILIKTKQELLKYKKQIFTLFQESFNDSIDEKLWDWAYMKNPNGDPLVSLYFDNEKLVGHYAVIPLKLIDKNNMGILGLLSMTTMVHLSYRKYGIFVDQANAIYDIAKLLGYKFVIGFPNEKAAPGLKKRLGWTLNKELYVAKLTKSELLSISPKNNLNKISFNSLDENNLEWRLNKPQKKYIKNGENILKIYNNEYDIVFDSGDYTKLDNTKQYNILLDRDFDKFIEKKEFNYIFGYKFFNDDDVVNNEFKIDLLMSDVF